jgi:hypothetical protein
VNSRNGLATRPGDGAGGSLLPRDPLMAAEQRPRPSRRLVVATVVAVIAVGAVGALLGGTYLLARDQYDRVYEARYETLAAIGEVRADQVTAWESERVSDVIATAGSPLVTDAVASVIANPDDAAILSQVVQQLDLVAQMGQTRTCCSSVSTAG